MNLSDQPPSPGGASAPKAPADALAAAKELLGDAWANRAEPKRAGRVVSVKPCGDGTYPKNHEIMGKMREKIHKIS